MLVPPTWLVGAAWGAHQRSCPEYQLVRALCSPTGPIDPPADLCVLSMATVLFPFHRPGLASFGRRIGVEHGGPQFVELGRGSDCPAQLPGGPSRRSLGGTEYVWRTAPPLPRFPASGVSIRPAWQKTTSRTDRRELRRTLPPTSARSGGPGRHACQLRSVSAPRAGPDLPDVRRHSAVAPRSRASMTRWSPAI